MTYYPVIIPTLCRYEKFKTLIDSLVCCKEASSTELIIGLDYPPSEKYVEGWKKIKNYIPTILGFKNVICIEQKKNIGSAHNSYLLQQYAFKENDAYIYSEDDNIFSPYFLQYMNEALEKYKENLSIFAICGYSYPIDWKTKKDCVLQHQYFSAWGYGCWKNKEDIFLKDINNNFFSHFFYMKDIRNLIKKSPSNFIGFMDYAFYDKIPSYDITRSFYMLIRNLNVLMPTKTLVSNDGWDGSGENYIDKSYIDFSNFNRNDTIPINVNNVEIVYSKELERAIFSLKPKFAFFKAKIKAYLIIIIGLKYAKKIRNILKKRN